MSSLILSLDKAPGHVINYYKILPEVSGLSSFIKIAYPTYNLRDDNSLGYLAYKIQLEVHNIVILLILRYKGPLIDVLVYFRESSLQGHQAS